MQGDPCSWSEVWEALDREIGEPGKNRGEIVAHREFQPSAAFHDREDRRNLRSRMQTADVHPVLSSQSHSTHRIFRKVIAQLKFRIFQESRKLPPQCESVLAGLAECTGGQSDGLRCIDLATVVFDFRLGRGRDGPKRFLGEFEGILQTDGYAAYDQIGGTRIVHAACWAHARRQFFEAVQSDGKESAIGLNG
jgi:hypothetical protein